MKHRLLSKQEAAKHKKLLEQYHKLGDEIIRCKHLRETTSHKIAQLICPFRVGDRVYGPKPTKFSSSPKGLCEVIEIFAVIFPFEIDQHLTQPHYRFRVKKVLKNGKLSQRTYTAFWPDHWREAK